MDSVTVLRRDRRTVVISLAGALEAARAAFGLIRYADDGFGLPAGDGAACPPPPSHGARRHEL